jgi:hypothetical protein
MKYGKTKTDLFRIHELAKPGSDIIKAPGMKGFDGRG